MWKHKKAFWREIEKKKQYNTTTLGESFSRECSIYQEGSPVGFADLQRAIYNNDIQFVFFFT